MVQRLGRWLDKTCILQTLNTRSCILLRTHLKDLGSLPFFFFFLRSRLRMPQNKVLDRLAESVSSVFTQRPSLSTYMKSNWRIQRMSISGPHIQSVTHIIGHACFTKILTPNWDFGLNENYDKSLYKICPTNINYYWWFTIDFFYQ